MPQVDLDCLSEAYRAEQRDYYLNTSAWAEVHPAQLLGPGTLIKSYDLNKVTLDELKVGRVWQHMLQCWFKLQSKCSM
jgi:protein arginine N-methyltransferase 1